MEVVCWLALGGGLHLQLSPRISIPNMIFPCHSSCKITSRKTKLTVMGLWCVNEGTMADVNAFSASFLITLESGVVICDGQTAVSGLASFELDWCVRQVIQGTFSGLVRGYKTASSAPCCFILQVERVHVPPASMHSSGTSSEWFVWNGVRDSSLLPGHVFF